MSSPTIRLREAQPSDTEHMARLHSETFLDDPWDKAFLGALLARPGSYCLIAGAKSIEGFILVQMAADEAEILTLCVHPQHRRRGIGQHLLQEVIRKLGACGINTIFLDVSVKNTPALRLYRDASFQECGQRRSYYKNGDDALIMARMIAPNEP